MWKPYTNHKYFERCYGVSHRGIAKISDLVVLLVGVIFGAGNRDSGALITVIDLLLLPDTLGMSLTDTLGFSIVLLC